MSTIKIAPSILSADFGRMGEQVKEAADGGADYIHVDMMDGRFVPALTFGTQMVEAIKPWSKAPLDVHMMVADPDRFIDDVATAGADIITVHAEACRHLHRVVHQIKDTGNRAGVAINPSTPVTAIEEVLPDLDLVLVMTVNPGYGGQAYIGIMESKIARVRSLIDEQGLQTELEVDGGLKPETAGRAAKAGGRVLVAGSAVYASGSSVADSISAIRVAAESAL